MTAIRSIAGWCGLPFAYGAAAVLLILQAASIPLQGESLTTISQNAGGTSSGEIDPAFLPQAPFEWNVFLGPWYVIGPFLKPQPEGPRRGLDVDYLGTEPQVHLDASVPYHGKEYRWQRYDRQVLDLFGAFAMDNKDTDYVVAYAWTRFFSDKAQDVVLAIGSDDGFIAWLNGEKVAEHIGIRGNYLDDDMATVHLPKGESTLLLKVENWYSPWGAVARLLPPHIEQPLLNFEWTNADSLGECSNFQLPDLTIDYLDSRGEVAGTQHCSGFRAHNWTRPLYQLYAPAPEPPPASVRVRIQQDGYTPFEKIVSWNDAWREPVEVAADGAMTVTGRVVDAVTGTPISGARVVCAEYRVLGETSEPDGSFQFRGVSPFFDWLTVSAPGYMARFPHLSPDDSRPLEIDLTPGGKTLQGRVADDQDNPIEDAVVWYWSWTTHDGRIDRTDQDGRFVLAGISSSNQSVWVTVQHRYYAPVELFKQPLGDADIMQVVYRMKPGAVVAGHVLARGDRRLLSGVRVAWDEGRRTRSAFPDVFTDVNGHYQLTDVPTGPNNVFAISDEFAPAMRQINAGLGYTVEVDFDLEPGEDIAGRVVGPDGKPISGATVFVDDWNGVRTLERETVTDADGRFVLHQMPPTAVTLCAVTDDYLSTAGIEVVSGNHYDIVLQLAPRRAIRVWPKDSDRGG